MKNKAFFFDRDGIINKRIIDGYVTQPSEFILNDEIPNIIKYLHHNSYKLIVITNQQGVGKGLMSLDALSIVHNYMQKLLIEKCGAAFDDIYYSTDLHSANSFRRKPNPGMLLESIEKYNIDPNKSFMIGDSETDVIAGNSAGVKTIYVGEDNITAIPNYHIKSLDTLHNLIINLVTEE